LKGRATYFKGRLWPSRLEMFNARAATSLISGSAAWHSPPRAAWPLSCLQVLDAICAAANLPLGSPLGLTDAEGFSVPVCAQLPSGAYAVSIRTAAASLADAHHFAAPSLGDSALGTAPPRQLPITTTVDVLNRSTTSVDSRQSGGNYVAMTEARGEMLAALEHSPLAVDASDEPVVVLPPNDEQLEDRLIKVWFTSARPRGTQLQPKLM